MDDSPQVTKPSGLGVEQYLGVWAIAPNHMPSELPAPVQATASVRDNVSEVLGFTVSSANPLPRIDNTAVIDIRGTMSKYGSFFSSAGSTVIARRKLQVALADPTIESIMILIESPGGAMSGNLDLANDIAAAGKQKPVGAFIEDLGASAAYQIASQASFISTTRSSLVGSIGTFTAVYDYSEMLGKLGIKAVVVKAGDLKGMGVTGTPITDEQKAELQKIVNAANDQFLESVSTGRGLSMAEVKGLADGAIHMGEEAKILGLVDHVESFQEALQRLQSINQQTGEKVMSESVTESTPQAATLTEIKACCPNAGADFYMEQLEAGATKAEAQQAFVLKLQQDLSAANKEMAEAKTQAQASEEKARHAQMKKEGNEPIENNGQAEDGFTGSVVQEFEAAIAANIAKGMDNLEATSQADLDNPGMREAYLEHKQTVDRTLSIPKN